jgi:dGTPase
MREYGGFEHNFQSLRVVEHLEEKYPEFDGLNLMFDTREGILKHCSLKNARHMGALGQRFIDRTQPSLEAQLTNIADEIAYNNHDVDDGLRSGLISIQQLRECSLFASHFESVENQYPGLSDKRKAQTVIRNMIDRCVTDLIETTQNNITQQEIKSIEDVRNNNQPLAGFSPEIKTQIVELKSFLHSNLYQHEQVAAMSLNAKTTISTLFDGFFEDSALLPQEHQKKALHKQQNQGVDGYARVISDYIAGMTDRYAQAEYQRLKT